MLTSHGLPADGYAMSRTVHRVVDPVLVRALSLLSQLVVRPVAWAERRSH